MKLRRLTSILAAIPAGAILLLCGCADVGEHSETFYAMDTVMTITAYGKNAEAGTSAAREEILAKDKLWSVTNGNSTLYALDHGASAADADTLALISYALDISEKTGGALDPTVYPILTAWGFTTDENRVPDDEELSRLLENVGYERVTVAENEVRLPEGMMLDLGAVAKGRASDLAAELLRENGVSSAIINLGGNVYALGKKPDGSDWRIGIKDPESENSVGVLSLSDRAVVTSGSYERCFTAPDGTVYGHIIDPKTGYPVNNELLSATMIAADGTLCDALSTAMFVMGSEAAESYWRENGGFDMILITKNHELILTEGVEKNFALLEKNYTVSVLRKQPVQ